MDRTQEVTGSSPVGSTSTRTMFSPPGGDSRGRLCTYGCSKRLGAPGLREVVPLLEEEPVMPLLFYLLPGNGFWQREATGGLGLLGHVGGQLGGTALPLLWAGGTPL